MKSLYLARFRKYEHPSGVDIIRVTLKQANCLAFLVPIRTGVTVAATADVV